MTLIFPVQIKGINLVVLLLIASKGVDCINNRLLYIGSILLSLGAFVLDMYSPAGYTEWVFYLLPVLLISFSSNENFIFSIALANSLLMIGGTFLSEDFRAYIVIVHRVLGLVMIWILYSNITMRNRSVNKLVEREHQLNSANANLLQRSAEFNHAQEVARIGSWKMNVRHNKLFWSDEAYRIFGVGKGTPMNRESFLSKVHPDDQKFVENQFQELLKGGTFDIQHRIISNGQVKWIRGKAERDFNKDGELQGAVGTVQDITEKVIGEQERERLLQETQESRNALKILNENLESMVVQRTMQVRELAKALTLTEQRERQKLSLLLHEDLQQILLSIKLRINLLEQSTCEEPEVLEDLSEIKRLTNKAIVTAKTLAVELNPPILHNEGLDAALKWMTQYFDSHFGLHIKTEITEAFIELGEEERILLVQFVRELLTNIVKHAETADADLYVFREDTSILVRLHDYGKGFNVESARKLHSERKHFGLFGIEERLKLIGGHLDIKSSSGQGTTAVMVVPLQIR